jgi:uncharacterized membrane protein
MKLNPILIIAIAANALSYILLDYSNGLPAKQMDRVDIVISIMWGLVIILAITFCRYKGQVLFKKPALIWTIVSFIFCTPVPFIVIYQLIDRV